MAYVDILGLAAEQKVGIPDWKVFKYEVIENSRFLLTGAVTKTYVQGPKKGKPNWKTKDSSTLRKVVITEEEKDKFIVEWEAVTGLCIKCVGSGQQLAGWSVEAGQKYRPCTRCGSSGNAKEVSNERTSNGSR